LQIKTKIVSCHTADSKAAKQEFNHTVILPPLVFPGFSFTQHCFLPMALLPGNIYQRGMLSTVVHRIVKSFDQVVLIMQTIFTIFLNKKCQLQMTKKGIRAIV
jgi:hypothetical protein